MSDYHVNIFWSGEDGCYVADPAELDSRLHREVFVTRLEVGVG